MPKNIKEVQKFLELANYYKQFIKNFARIIAPLHLLVRKEEKQRQKEEQEETFRRLKEVFIIKLVLAILDLNKKIRVEADILDYTTREILLVKYGYQALATRTNFGMVSHCQKNQKEPLAGV